MKLDFDCYDRYHNYHNEKVAKWIAENYEVDTPQSIYSCYAPVCSCDTYEKEDERDHYLLDDEGNKTDEPYEGYYEKFDGESLSEEIPGLTESEKEELIDIINVRVYACPHCLWWAMDGDNC